MDWHDLEAFAATQPAVARYLAHALHGLLQGQHSLSHAYLLCANQATEAYALVLTLARLLNCQGEDRPSPLKACGRCRSCLWLANNAHPGLITVTPKTGLSGTDVPVKKDAHTISTEQMKALLGRLLLKAVGDEWRLVVFTESELTANTVLDTAYLAQKQALRMALPYEWRAAAAEGLGEEALLTAEDPYRLYPLRQGSFSDKAANQFLKTLEEPPERTLFFFIVGQEEALLRTVRSRCQVLHLANAPLNVLPAQQATLAPVLEALWGHVTQAPAALQALNGLHWVQGWQEALAKGSLTWGQAFPLLEAALSRYLADALPTLEAAHHTVLLGRYAAVQQTLQVAQNQLQHNVAEAKVAEQWAQQVLALR